MSHEIIHYQQWLEDREMDEKEAEYGSEELLDNYYGFLRFDILVERCRIDV
jgi:hypothetical protein